MGSQSLFLQALMNNFVKGYANQQLAIEEATESLGSPGAPDDQPASPGASACAMRLFALTLKSLRSTTAPAVNAKDLVARHTRKRLQLKKKANGCEQADVAGVFDKQAARLRKLNKELAAYSKGQLERVDDAKTAKKLIRMFDLPQETYREWNEGRRRRGTKSPSPRQSRKRKSPEGGLPPRQPTPSRFAPPGSRAAGVGGVSGGLLAPKRLFVWEEQIADDVAAGVPLGQATRAQRGSGGPPPKAGVKEQAAAAATAAAAAGPGKRKPRKPAAPKPSATSSCERPSSRDPAGHAELLPWNAFMDYLQQPAEQLQHQQQPLATQQAHGGYTDSICDFAFAAGSDACPGYDSCALDSLRTLDYTSPAACAAALCGTAAAGTVGPAQDEGLVPLLAALEQSMSAAAAAEPLPALGQAAIVPAAEPLTRSPFALPASQQPPQPLAPASWDVADGAAELCLAALLAATISPGCSCGLAPSSHLATCGGDSSCGGDGSCGAPSGLAAAVERPSHTASTCSADCCWGYYGGSSAAASADRAAAAGAGCWQYPGGSAAAAAPMAAAADEPCPQADLLHSELVQRPPVLPEQCGCGGNMAAPARSEADVPKATPALAAVPASTGSSAASNAGSDLLPVLAPAQRRWRDLQCPPSPKAEVGPATVAAAQTPSEPAAGCDATAAAGAAPSEQQGQVGSCCGAAPVDSLRRSGSSINPLGWGCCGCGSSRGAKRRRSAAAPGTDNGCHGSGCRDSSDSEGEEGASDGAGTDAPARNVLALSLLGHRGAAFSCGPVSNTQVVVEASSLRLHSRRESPFSAAARQAFEGMSLLQQQHATGLSRPLQLSF
ncbi:hypothetical protein N2152v2_002579 [Parachlorella kessleri]